MFWKKKKKMVDVRELQRRGVMRIPRNNVGELPTDKEGFVEVGGSGNVPSNPIINSTTSAAQTATQSAGDFFSFMDNPATTSTIPAGSASSASSADLRKISAQLSDLDNKLYKMEQRIELLERKAGVQGY